MSSARNCATAGSRKILAAPGDHHLRPELPILSRDLQANATAATGNQRDPPFQYITCKHCASFVVSSITRRTACKRARLQSTFAPDSLMSRAHLGMSSLMIAVTASGVLTDSAHTFDLCLKSGVLIMPTMVELSFRIMSCGVPAGAMIASTTRQGRIQEDLTRRSWASLPIAGTRLAEVTASTLMRPESMYRMPASTLQKTIGICPLMMSVIDAPRLPCRGYMRHLYTRHHLQQFSC